MSRGAHQQQPGGAGGAGPKLKATPRALFSCGIFSTCTHPALSPTATPNNNGAAGNGGVKAGGGGSATPCGDASASPALVEAAAASAVPSPVQWHRQKQAVQGPGSNSNGAGPSSSSSSSSSSASQSFTQWRLPVHHPPHAVSSASAAGAGGAGGGHEVASSAEEKFAAGEVVAALRAVERDMEAAETSRTVPAGVVAGVVAAVREPATARLAAKVLLVVLLEEGNRAAAVRREALAAPVLARAVEGMAGRGRECAIGVLAAIYGGEEAAGASPPPPEVVKAVVGAMQGECSARGRRKGAQLLRALQEGGRLGLAWDGVGGS